MDAEPYMREPDWRRVDHGLLTHGYIREYLDVFGLKPSAAPSEIVDLCQQYTKTTIFATEADDPINFISSTDEERSEQYKLEGNCYFKAKQYDQAIVKYTSALNHNPNNHLLFSNRAYCYYLLQNYEDAITDIKQCMHFQPCFVKGWYRYGLILEKLDRFGEAGVAYQTAINLGEYEMKCPNTTRKTALELCKSRYLKFMKSLRKTDKKKALQFMADFGKDPWASSLHTVMNKLEEKGIEVLDHDLEELAELHPEARELIKRQELAELLSYVGQSRYRQVIAEGALKYQNDMFGCWNLSWSSKSDIHYNKRLFHLSIAAGQLAIGVEPFFGIPNAQRIIHVLYRKMAYTRMEPLPPMYCMKPRIICISFRMKAEFKKIKAAMSALGIQCYLESEWETRHACDAKGTRFDGMNHLMEWEAVYKDIL